MPATTFLVEKLMHIALTGASGFIGSVIAKQLHERGHTVTALVREMSRRDHIESFIERFVVGEQGDASSWDELLDGADAVVHNSVDWQPLKSNDLARHLQSNLVGSIKLIDAARRPSDPRPFVFLSTVAVHHDILPAWDGSITETHPLRPGNLYGAYKAAIEAHLWQEHFQHGTPAVALRPCAVYGIAPNLERSIGHPIVKRIRDREKFTRKGGGKFVHVEDVAAAVVASIEKKEAAGQPFNLADCYLRWADIAAMIAEILGINADIDFSSPEQSKNQFSKVAAREVLGVQLDRGRNGMKQYLTELIEVMA